MNTAILCLQAVKPKAKNAHTAWLILFFVCVSSRSMAQIEYYKPSSDLTMSTIHGGIKLGMGLATENNNQFGYTFQYESFRSVHHSFDIGFILQYQSYSLFFQNTVASPQTGQAYSGLSLRHTSGFFFIAPEVNVPIPNKKRPYALNFYMYGGPGLKLFGTESLAAWGSATSANSTVTSYDDTLNTSPNIKKFLFKGGFGFTEHSDIYKHFTYFTFTEDVSIILGNLSTAAVVNYPGKSDLGTINMPVIYVSFLIGYGRYHVLD